MPAAKGLGAGRSEGLHDVPGGAAELLLPLLLLLLVAAVGIAAHVAAAAAMVRGTGHPHVVCVGDAVDATCIAAPPLWGIRVKQLPGTQLLRCHLSLDIQLFMYRISLDSNRLYAFVVRF